MNAWYAFGYQFAALLNAPLYSNFLCFFIVFASAKRRG
jgi:hypothetical protein